MTQSTFVSSQLIDAGSICPTAPHIALPLHSLYPAFGIDNVRLPLHIDQLRSAFSTAAFTREESRRAAAVHVHPPVLGYCSTHTRLVSSHSYHAFTRRLLCEQAQPLHPPSLALPPSFPLIQQMPAGLVHTGSP